MIRDENTIIMMYDTYLNISGVSYTFEIELSKQKCYIRLTSLKGLPRQNKISVQNKTEQKGRQISY